MNSIDLADASREFPELVKKVERGEGFLITRDGQTVARLVPQNGDEKESEAASHGLQDKLDDPKRAEARRRVIANMKKGVHLGGLKINREELYDR